MVRDAGGSRTHSNAALQAAAVPSGSSVTSVLARNRTWTSTFAGLHAHPAHPEDVNLLAAHRGVEPRLAVSRTAVRSGTLAGCVNQCPDLGLNQGLDLRRVQCVPLHHRDKQSRRLDLHQHLPVYKTGAFFGRATSASARARGIEPRRAVLEAAGSPSSTLVYAARHTKGSQGI